MKYKTTARRAEEQLDHLLGPASGIYRQWQFENYLFEPLRIEGTVDDVLLLAKSNTYLRPQFKIDEQSLTIPNLFVKLNGDVKGFYLDMKQLSRVHGDIVVIYHSFAKMASAPRKRPLISKPSWFDEAAGIDVEAALKIGIANLKFLRPAYQKNYLLAINRVLARLKSADFLAEVPAPRLVLETLLFNSNKIIRMFHKFDYHYINPKFIVKADAADKISSYAVLRLLMMNALGFDVFILSETGYASVENYLTEDFCKRYFLTPKERAHSAVLSRRRKLWRYVGIGLVAGLLIGAAALAVGRGLF